MKSRKNNINRPAPSRRLLLQLFAMMTLAAAPNCVYAQSLGFHYKGHSGMPLDSRGMQQTAEWHYNYYLPTSSSTMELELPFVGWTGECNDLEPYGWIRWYDYTTDKASDQLTPYNSGSTNTLLLQGKDKKSGTDIGLCAYKIPTPLQNYRNSVGVYYKKPSGADAADWAGETIACDVSRYIDYKTTTSRRVTYISQEPTLSIRYIFHIRSAAYLANQIKEALCNGSANEYADLTLEDNKRIVFGAKNDAAKMTLRTNLKNSGGQTYWFYPLSNATNGKSVYATTESQKIKASNFQSTIKQAKYIRWIAYNEDRTKYCVLAAKGNQFYDFKISDLKNSSGWKNVEGNASASTPSDIGYGHTAYIVAYAYDGTNMCPVANFEVFIHQGYPKMKSEINSDGDVDRTISYLESKYNRAMDPISFDKDNPDLTFARPTTALNNMSLKPSDFKSRAYGFTYAELASKDYYNGGTHYGKSPIHGDYGLYKSGNLSGISANGENGYLWWAYGSPTIYDRTYEKTGGKQYGHFLYVDASDESRQIASADFQANLCTGSQLVFSGAVAEYTAANAAAPQVMFRLYGINKDENGNVIDQKLIQSFTSGDFATNTKDHKYGKWYQIFSKQVLQKSTGVSNFTDFRIVLDNMCKSTGGADYCIDDLCLYTQTSKLDVLQNRPLCPSENGYETAPKEITLKLRGIYETFQAMVNMKESKLFYRICDENGKPVEGIDYHNNGKNYGVARIPATYNAAAVLPAEAADGLTNVPMFENDNSGNRCLVIANRNFNIVPGKNFYVSIAYPSDDNAEMPGAWGTPTDVCSTYSDPFQIVKQSIKVTDANGTAITSVRVKCDGSNTGNVSVNIKLETVDKVNGGKVELPDVKFDWFFSENNKSNDINTNGVREALNHFRDVYPNATTLQSAKNRFTTADRALLKQYIDNGRLLISASSTISKFTTFGNFEVAAVPIATSITVGGQQYDVCPDPMLFPLRIVKDGPRVYTGFKDVTYPSDDRTLRIGLPQIKAIANGNGSLQLPMTSMEDADRVTLENNGKVWIASTNDPQMTLTSGTEQSIGNVTTATINKNDETIGIRFNSNAASRLREGYWYELNFSFNNTESSSTASCPGEVFVKMLVVPEYATWQPSTTTHAAWNSDANWLRSSKAEIYKADYAEYNGTREAAYMPMKFTKVTVPTLTGHIYPNLGEIRYQTNGIANGVGNIAYDIVTKWSYQTADGSDNGNGTFSCEKWTGNLCDQIYFKPEAELLYANYLAYNKAYVDKLLTPNTWSVMSSPLKQTYAGDLYVPKANGQEQSEAFKPMTFNEAVNDRNAYPIYQRSWDGDVQQVIDNTTFYKANHDGQIEETTGNEITLNSAYWTHVYNKVDEAYAKGKAFAVKAGDKYTEGAKNNSFALIRLPKADTQYSYYDSQSNTNVSATVQKTADNYRMQLGDDANDHTMQLLQPLNRNVQEGNSYHLVGNPYTSSLSMYHFLKTNSAFEGSVWTFTDGKFTAHAIDTSLDYDKKKDVIIPPTQAFFVKVKNGEAPTDVTFNAAMIINRWVTPGEKIMLVRPTLTMTTSDGVRSSQSELIVNDEASRDYVEGEDVEMLGEGNIAEIAQVYSVAGTQAVALNASDDINWMPVGVVAPKSKDIDVNISLNGKMLRKMNDEGGKLFIYDATTKKFTEIADGMKVQMMANDHGRYYLTNNNWVVPTGISAVHCFSPSPSTIIVAALNGEVKQVVVYDIAGSLVTSNHSSIGERCQLNVQQPGVYIVKATTKEDKTETFKIVVK
ncbi:T9SS type A sorting domain-containing protein [uncultured Prevotella sp.]|uniref:T9SS type A sorting domain-containing protein n=1 Tax=uncultured Prevotella sp. TaxID=159272 RepID=UPI002677434A|nr:T9SS type A sorting domain-containing protein [uncultured Prevotella sp.]